MQSEPQFLGVSKSLLESLGKFWAKAKRLETGAILKIRQAEYAQFNLEDMQPSQVRTATAKDIAALLDAAKGVDQTHFRNALANALERIDRLERNMPAMTLQAKC